MQSKMTLNAEIDVCARHACLVFLKAADILVFHAKPESTATDQKMERIQ